MRVFLTLINEPVVPLHFKHVKPEEVQDKLRGAKAVHRVPHRGKMPEIDLDTRLRGADVGHETIDHLEIDGEPGPGDVTVGVGYDTQTERAWFAIRQH